MKSHRVMRYLKIITAMLLVLVAIYGTLRFLSAPANTHPLFSPKNFLVIAHRGGRGLGPESTLYTFEKAVEMGVDMLEMDIRATRDNHLVVFHDARLDRTTDGKGQIAEFLLSELESLDAGFHWSPDNGKTNPLRDRSIRIPTLAKVFQTFPEARMNLEIKDTRPIIAATLCDLIEKHNMTSNVMVACFDAGVLKQFRRQCPQVATSAGFSEVATFFALQRLRLQSVYSPSASALQVPEKYDGTTVVNHQFVRAAHERNMSVHVWTVNDADDMRRLIETGVDGIMTDYPQRLIEILKTD